MAKYNAIINDLKAIANLRIALFQRIDTILTELVSREKLVAHGVSEKAKVLL